MRGVSVTPSFQLDIQVSLNKQEGCFVTLFVIYARVLSLFLTRTLCFTVHATAMGFTSASFIERMAMEQGISALGFPAPSSKA